MSNIDYRSLFKHPILTCIAVTECVILVSIGLLTAVSHVAEKINNLSTQLTDLNENYERTKDFMKGVERCVYCGKEYRRRGNLNKHEYSCGLFRELY